MSAILELLLRLAYVLLAALGLRAFERQGKAGLPRDAELAELLAIAEERRQRRPIAAFPGPPSAECTVYDQRRRTAAAQGRANGGSGRGARTGDQRSITSVKRAGRALRLPPAPSDDDDRDPLGRLRPRSGLRSGPECGAGRCA